MALKRINKVTKTNNPTVLSLLFVFFRPFTRLSLDLFPYLDVNFALVVFICREGGSIIMRRNLGLSDLLYLSSACLINLYSATYVHAFFLRRGGGCVCRISFRLSLTASSQFIQRRKLFLFRFFGSFRKLSSLIRVFAFVVVVLLMLLLCMTLQ